MRFANFDASCMAGFCWIPVRSPSQLENNERERESLLEAFNGIWPIRGNQENVRCVCFAKAIRSKVRRRAHAGHPKSGRHGVAAAASGTVSTPIGLQVLWWRWVWVIAIGTPTGTLQGQNRRSIL